MGIGNDELRALIDEPERRRQVSAAALAEAFLERIEELEPLIHAFITVTPDLAREDARRADEARSHGEPLPLDGMPIAVKDNIDVAGVPRTVASKFFESYVPEEDAEVVRRIRAAGGVIVGKAMLHEFVFGVTSNTQWFGTARNPWDTNRIPGGSSGGSGAAVGADLAIGALGSDTGGSVRIPAAVNGVTGLRATFGSISNHGAFPISWTFDTVGPLARSVGDVARIYSAMAGFDPSDPRAVEGPIRDPFPELGRGVKGLRIGLPRNFFFEDLEPDIEEVTRAAAQVFAELGAELSDIDVPGVDEANDVCTLMIRAEARALHRERYDTQRELFGEDIARRLALADTITGADYAGYIQWMYDWRRTMRRIFEDVDLILTPTTNAAAPSIEGAEMIATTAKLTRFTYSWSLASMPAISLPAGPNSEGLPLGVQLAAAPWNDALLLRAGAAYQGVTDWHRRRPPPLVAAAA